MFLPIRNLHDVKRKTLLRREHQPQRQRIPTALQPPDRHPVDQATVRPGFLRNPFSLFFVIVIELLQTAEVLRLFKLLPVIEFVKEN